jgi:hypothetical protein
LFAPLSPARAEEPLLTEALFERLRDSMRLERQPWARIPWKASTTRAREAAARERKPIVLVVNTGNCLGFV